MLKIGILGIVGLLTALVVKEFKPQFAALISIATCLLIFFYSISKLSYLVDTLQNLSDYIQLKESYITTLLKIVGITYVADFSANLCKDSGHNAIASQIEFFGKISILSISVPIIVALLETIHGFLS